MVDSPEYGLGDLDEDEEPLFADDIDDDDDPPPLPPPVPPLSQMTNSGAAFGVNYNTDENIGGKAMVIRSI